MDNRGSYFYGFHPLIERVKKMKKITKYIKELFTGRRNFWEVFCVWGIIFNFLFLLFLFFIIFLIQENKITVDPVKFLIFFWLFIYIPSFMYSLIVNLIKSFKIGFKIIFFRIILTLLIFYYFYVLYNFFWTLSYK
jgi:hypothetical protein